jgi:hypothetical protein
LPQLRLSGNVVSLLFLYAGKPVLLSEFRGDDVLLKKLAGTETDARSVTVRGPFSGLWLSGSSHVVIFPREPTRLAGNTLIWRENVTTYRLEGRTLTKRDALDLARSLVDTP